jgi:hypothetical protein
LRFGGLPAITLQIQDEKLPLADLLDVVKSERRQGVLDGLSLGIEYDAFRHYPNVSFHRTHYSKPNAAAPE